MIELFGATLEQPKRCVKLVSATEATTYVELVLALQAGSRGFESRHVHHYDLPTSYDLCCIFDYRLPNIFRRIRSNNRFGELNHGDNQMKEEDRMRTSRHPGMVSKPEKTPHFGPIQ